VDAGVGHYLARFPEEVWEQYARGALSEEECEPLEEHLLICSACQHLLAELDAYIRVIKAAAAVAAENLSARQTCLDGRSEDTAAESRNSELGSVGHSHHRHHTGLNRI